MQQIYRIIDANLNRASEGLRVLEDLSRFYYSDQGLSEEIKQLRHKVRKNIEICRDRCLLARDSRNDVGVEVSKKLAVDNRHSLNDLVSANFKRAEEALRVIEEYLKVLGEYAAAKLYEGFRFEAYTLEKEFHRMNFSQTKRAKLNTDLYCITGEEYSKGRDNIQVVESMIKAGVKIIQYREKEKKLRQKYQECLKIRQMTKDAGVTFIVNDDIDIAILVQADGVHIGQDDLPIEKVRELAGAEMIIGLSTHSPEQAHDALQRGADYIGVGPIYRTFTKKDVCEPVGLEYLEYVAGNIDIPFVAIGGIKEHNIEEVAVRGAGCVALVTEIVGAESIEDKIKCIRQKLKGCVNGV
ncbi:MAG TPA: thiamine phosphate synthase [Desulfobacteria bacterium]|nr:thiamine phosphate synthase [Desulfobacteria bacterium]